MVKLYVENLLQNELTMAGVFLSGESFLIDVGKAFGPHVFFGPGGVEDRHSAFERRKKTSRGSHIA